MTARDLEAPPEVVTFGETMAALRAHAALRLGGSLGLSVAGAESNVAIGLARLGHRVRWAGRVGADELGALVLRTLRAEGVDIDHALTDDTGRPTGLLLTEPRLGTLTRVSYYRAGSAGSAVSPADVLPALAPGSRILHLTGITPVLSPSAAEAALAAATTAREAGITVCLDVNHRSRLWTADRARTVLRPLLARTDLLIASEDELPLVLERPAADETEAVRSILAAGVTEVVVKRGAAGATSVTADGATDCAARQVDAFGRPHPRSPTCCAWAEPPVPKRREAPWPSCSTSPGSAGRSSNSTQGRHPLKRRSARTSASDLPRLRRS